MKEIYRIYVGNPSYKRVLLRKVPWSLCHRRNIKFNLTPNFKGYRHWFWNINRSIFGIEKHNTRMYTNLIDRLNQHLENGMLPERVDETIRMAIAALAKKNDNISIDDKPVAWLYDVTDIDNGDIESRLHFYKPLDCVDNISNVVPLYMSPHNKRGLLDHEIIEVRNKFWDISKHYIEFARAIEKAHGIGGKVTNELMKFDPSNGEEKPYPSQADQYRKYHGMVAWLFNPFTGTKRDPRDIGTDTFGHLIE